MEGTLSNNFYDGPIRPLASNRAPAKRYAQFITAFEKFVEAQQKACEGASRMELPYNITVEAMAAADLPNDCSVTLSNGLVMVQVFAAPEDSLRTFQPALHLIGTGLLKRGLHGNGQAAVRFGGSQRQVDWCFQLRSGAENWGAVRMWLLVPRKGIIDLDFEEIQESYTSYQYKVRWRDGAAPLLQCEPAEEEVLF